MIKGASALEVAAMPPVFPPNAPASALREDRGDHAWPGVRRADTS
jgi:hypothetical protein